MLNWVKDAVIKRFDERSIQCDKTHDMEMIMKQLVDMERDIIHSYSDDAQKSVHDYLELYVRMTAIQNEWLYLKGIQDGMHMLMYVQLDRL